MKNSGAERFSPNESKGDDLSTVREVATWLRSLGDEKKAQTLYAKVNDLLTERMGGNMVGSRVKVDVSRLKQELKEYIGTIFVEATLRAKKSRVDLGEPVAQHPTLRGRRTAAEKSYNGVLPQQAADLAATKQEARRDALLKLVAAL